MQFTRKKIMKILFVSFLFLILHCSSGSVAYVKTYPGILVEDAEEKETFLFFNEKLSKISENKDVGRYKEEISGKKFSIQNKHISFSLNTLFYSVDTRSGLFLRSEPNQKADRIVLMPYKSSGKIIDIKKEFSVIEKLRAPWLKVSYKDKIGWAFAGYIRVFRTEEELKEFLRQKNDFDKFYNFKETDKLTGFQFQELIQKVKNQKPDKIYENEIYEILDLRYLYKENKDDGKECSIPKWNQLVFKNKITNEYFTVQNIEGELSHISEKIIHADNPIDGLIHTESICCWCCCGCDGSTTYFLAKDKPYFIEQDFSGSHGIAQCVNEPDYRYLTTEDDVRRIQNHSVYAIIKKPACEFAETGEFLVTAPRDLHLLINFKNKNFSYQKKVTPSNKIPEEFKDSFDQSEKYFSPKTKSIDWYKVIEEYTEKK